jgi:hypothetical protein
MSQAGSNMASSGQAVLRLVADTGTAIPSGGVINVNGDQIYIGTAASGDTLVIAYAPTYTSVNAAASPYTVTSTDNYISVDVTGGAVTLLLPNDPGASRTFTVKDRGGMAATNTITVTTVGGVVLLDGATSFVMNTDYEAINILFNGTSYEIF